MLKSHSKSNSQWIISKCPSTGMSVLIPQTEWSKLNLKTEEQMDSAIYVLIAYQSYQKLYFIKRLHIVLSVKNSKAANELVLCKSSEEQKFKPVKQDLIF